MFKRFVSFKPDDAYPCVKELGRNYYKHPEWILLRCDIDLKKRYVIT